MDAIKNLKKKKKKKSDTHHEESQPLTKANLTVHRRTISIDEDEEYEDSQQKPLNLAAPPSRTHRKARSDESKPKHVRFKTQIIESMKAQSVDYEADYRFGSDFLTCHQTRFIERSAGSHPNVTIKGNIRSYLYMYHELIDTSWLRLFFYMFLLFLVFNLLFGSIFYAMDGVQWNGSSDNITWSDCFFFVLQTMDTIGYGALTPKGTAANWLVFFQSYVAGIFWTGFTGVVFAKLSRPSRLKRQLKFSQVAVVNRVTRCFVPYFPEDGLPATEINITRRNHSEADTTSTDDKKRKKETMDGKWSEYGEYLTGDECLVFRFGDMRHRSRICEGSFSLLFFRRSYRESDGYEDYSLEEMDFEINEQYGRMRSLGTSVPLLSLPWTVVHRIDALSPLYQMSKQELIQSKAEIIAVVDGIDEATSDNFQTWWSYTSDEIIWNYQFEPMVKAVVKPSGTVSRIESSKSSLRSGVSSSHNLRSRRRRGRRMQNYYKQVLEVDYDRISNIEPVINRDLFNHACEKK